MAAKEKNSTKELELMQVKHQAIQEEESLEEQKAKLERHFGGLGPLMDEIGVEHDKREKLLIEQME